ncbi:MAG: L-carnitine dehydratase/bile acid-inducible protein [Caulobacter sp.]|nr:L-carnitine dehydratase/bile acid-inducible protein [Caulobacter sp.]
MKLSGLKVLDLSLFLPGPMLTLMMADHGANVIKVEPAGEGEPTRHLGYMKSGASIWFRNTQRGKRSIQLDLKSDDGKAVFWSLAREADVIIEAFRPGVVDRLGVGYGTVKAVNPGIVYCSISAFGQEGKYREKPAHDLAIQAMAGLVAHTEGFDGNPAPPGLVAGDALGSLTALSGVMMALWRKDRTGQGDYLDVSMLDSLMAWTPNVSGKIFATGEDIIPKHERPFGGQAMNSLYECKDGGWVALGGSEVKFARNLLSAWERLDLLHYAEIPPGPGQYPLRDFFRSKFKEKTRAEWEAWFEGRDICFAPVRTLKDAFEDDAAKERGMIAWDEAGNEIVGTPLRFKEEPGVIDPTIAGIDEHHAQIVAKGWET